MQMDKMSNEALKVAFKTLQPKIVKSVDPDSAIDELHAKDIITAKDSRELCDIQDTTKRCRKLLLILQDSKHSETFIRLREALLEDYPSIVDEVDKCQAESQAARAHQLQMDLSTEGTFLLPPYNVTWCIRK